MAKTTKDLITELDKAVTDQEVSAHMTQTALVVGFDLECKMIFHNESNRLDKLNTMVKKGGVPLGFIKVAKIGDDVQFFSKPLSGFEKNPKTQRILTELCTLAGKTMACGDQET
jgi:hypothetical protein